MFKYYNVLTCLQFIFLISILTSEGSSFAQSYKTIPTNFTIYKPKGTEMWTMDKLNPLNDSQFETNDKMKLNSDGSWKIIANTVRLNVLTSEGYDESKIKTVDKTELHENGFMMSPKDWKNIEMTGFVKLNSLEDNEKEKNDREEKEGEENKIEKKDRKKSKGIDYEEFDDNFSWYARGGQHNNDDGGCEGTAYKGNLHFSGNSSIVKEEWHTGGYFDAPEKKVTEPLLDRWIGFKFVLFNFQLQDNTTAVKIENWLDDDGNGMDWSKVYEAVDFGQWGDLDDGHCGKKATNTITWGGPIATFRWDNSEEMDVDIKNMSIVEIVPPKVNMTDIIQPYLTEYQMSNAT